MYLTRGNFSFQDLVVNVEFIEKKNYWSGNKQPSYNLFNLENILRFLKIRKGNVICKIMPITSQKNIKEQYQIVKMS